MAETRCCETPWPLLPLPGSGQPSCASPTSVMPPRVTVHDPHCFVTRTTRFRQALPRSLAGKQCFMLSWTSRGSVGGFSAVRFVVACAGRAEVGGVGVGPAQEDGGGIEQRLAQRGERACNPGRHAHDCGTRS